MTIGGTTGTYGTKVVTIDEITKHAIRRCGVSAAALTSEMAEIEIGRAHV